MAELSMQSILDCNDLELLKVEVKEWRGHLYLKPLTAKERDRLEQEAAAYTAGQGEPNYRGRFLAKSICDKNGKRLFDDAKASDLGEKSGKVMDYLFAKAIELNKVSAADIDQLEKSLKKTA